MIIISLKRLKWKDIGICKNYICLLVNWKLKGKSKKNKLIRIKQINKIKSKNQTQGILTT